MQRIGFAIALTLNSILVLLAEESRAAEVGVLIFSTERLQITIGREGQLLHEPLPGVGELDGRNIRLKLP